jgi:autotransporter-associated beta strand protein
MKSNRRSVLAVAVAATLAGAGAPRAATAALTFFVDPGSPWPTGWYNAAVANMQTTVDMYNAYGDFTLNNSASIYVYYNAGIPTAQAGYNASIGVGGAYPNVRVLLHESSHWLGTGTYSAYWGGPAASALIQQFDGVGSVMNGDGAHYWPYGENYDNESSAINDRRHIAMVYAFRKDFGIGSTAPPSSAANVALLGNDAAGESGFNYPWNWNDNHFAQPGTNYSTGSFAIRTPQGYPSWSFPGNSLTVNSGGSLLFNGWGTSGIVTVKNLVLSGATVKHDQFQQDTFQLAGNVNIAATSTFNASNGPIKVLAPMGGAGGLTKTGPYTLTVTGPATYSGDTTINAGTLRLAPVSPIASYTFDNVSGSSVVNGGTGGTGMNGTLANGASIVAGGQTGNAVSLASGASVDINNPITDLGNLGSWTVSAWVKTTTAGATILTKGDGTNWSGGNTILYLGDGTGPGSGGIPSSVRYAGGFFQGATGATAVNNNAWHQVTYVNSGGSYAIFVDGVAQPLSAGNNSFGNLDVGSVVRLGATTNNIASDGTVNFNGLMDNVKFFNQALSAGQVAALYQGNNLNGTLPSATNVSIAANAALDINNCNQTIGSLSGPVGAAAKLGSGQLTVSSAASSTFAGTISGNGGSLVKNGGGTLTLAGANTYTGATTISGGMLRLSNPAGVGAATPLASYSFANVSGNTVVNAGSGGAGMNGTLNANGGTGSINTSAGPGAGLGALVLNGNGTTVDINSGVTSLSNSATWTVSAWIKTTQAGATILNKGDGSTWNNGFSTFYLGTGADAGSGALPDAVRWGGGWLAGSTPVNDGKWHILTFTDTAGATAIYVDGVLETLSQSQFFNNDTGTKIRIGFAPTNVDGEVPTNGSLSGINIYNAALSAAQVAAMYNGIIGASTPLPATTDLTIAPAATLDVNGITQTVGSLSGSGAITLGSGQLIVNSAASTQYAGNISGVGGSFAKSGSGTLTLSGVNSYTAQTIVQGGKLRLTTDLTSSSAMLVTGGQLELASDGTKQRIIRTGVVAVTGAGQLDLADNKLIASVSPAGSWNGSAYTDIAGLIASGRNATAWNGPGIITTQSAASTSNYTSLGVARASDVRPNTASATELWAGQTISGSNTLVMYTYGGDANLDGKLNVDDYIRIDSGIAAGLSGWSNGDFNYDGKVNIDDYTTVIDANIGTQSGILPTAGGLKESVAGVTAIPEPATALVLAMISPVLLPRRRRRR